MIWAPYFEHSTIISNTCAVRYAYICADVAIIEDYCYARCHPMSPAAPYYRCSQPSLRAPSMAGDLPPPQRPTRFLQPPATLLPANRGGQAGSPMARPARRSAAPRQQHQPGLRAAASSSAELLPSVVTPTSYHHPRGHYREQPATRHKHPPH